MIRLAIVGIGGYGWELWEVIREVADDAGCQVVAAADARWQSIPERGMELQDEDIELYDDALAMFDAVRGRCDGVYIATGIHTHRLLATAAMEAGYHVHVEKPPAATVQEVDAMAHVVRERGRCCLVGFQAVHSLDMGAIEDRILSGRLG
ncbi:Gfo/Idh/MocA family oxidoreductase, partial [bacterium]|nr:Gfo/Idh/MocA family oxidoreductase [bacterium]